MKRLIFILLVSCGAVFSQQNALLLPWTPQQFTNTNGTVLANGKVCTYQAGTSTGLATYTDSTASVSNNVPPNAILLDSTGRPTSGGIWLSAAKAYKIIVLTAGSDSTCNTGVTIKTQDNVAASNVGANNIYTGDQFFKSGRPWFDVMAFGAKNDGATDDTAAIQAAITAACAAGGGTIFFPPSLNASKYYRVTASGATSPFIASCDNLTFLGENGTSFSGSSNMPAQIFAPNLNAPIFTTSGGQRFGLVFYGLQLTGAGAAQSGSQGINIVNSGSVIIANVYFGQFGSSCLVSQTGTGFYLFNNIGINCLKVLPSVDTGAVDISSSDSVANGNFFSASIPDVGGNLGTGHAYGWRINSANGSYWSNMAELSHHGWLFTATGNHNRVVADRGFLNQGSCIVNAGIGNNFTDIECLTNGQNANGTIDAVVVTAGDGVYSNIICNAVGGNGNATRHCISDSNSTGAGQAAENQYSNNRADTTAITGVLYNMTGTSPYLITHPHKISSDRGDNNVTIQCGVDAETQYFNTPLTVNRTVTFSNTGAWNGCRFRIMRTVSASGATALVTNAATGGNLAPGQSEDYEFTGTWQAVGTGILALAGTNNSAQLFQTDGRFVYGSVPVINCNTSQRTETAADANLLTCAIPAQAGSYRVRFVLSLSAANAATIGWTATWTDSNGAAQTPTNLALFQTGVAAPALTFTTSATGDYHGYADIDVNNAGTSPVVKLTFSGTSFTGKASATLERII